MEVMHETYGGEYMQSPTLTIVYDNPQTKLAKSMVKVTSESEVPGCYMKNPQ